MSKEEYISTEQRLRERVGLWESIVNDSNFSDDVKGQFLTVIEERFKNGKPINESSGDWVYYSVNGLLNVAEKNIKDGLAERDVMSLFTNLRDDIWLFYKEINK